MSSKLEECEHTSSKVFIYLPEFCKLVKNKPKGLEDAKEDQIAHMPYGQ